MQILKEEVFPFTRPALEMLDNINYVEPIFRYASFPSGHAATIFGVVLFWIKLTSVENLKLANKLILYIVLGLCCLRCFIKSYNSSPLVH